LAVKLSFLATKFCILVRKIAFDQLCSSHIKIVLMLFLKSLLCVIFNGILESFYYFSQQVSRTNSNVKSHFFQGDLLDVMSVFKKDSALNQYILKVKILVGPSPTTFCG
jgi:hypothetical protein